MFNYVYFFYSNLNRVVFCGRALSFFGNDMVYMGFYMYKHGRCLPFILALLISFPPAGIFARELLLTPKDVFEMPFDDLINVEMVSATKHSIKLKEAPAIAWVITADEIRKMGARNILDVLKRIPSLGIFIPEHSLKYGVEVRGIRTKLSEKILFLLDGRRLNNNIYGSAMMVYSKMSVENLKRIEVITGPGSALYGANAFLAVINFISKDAEDIDGIETVVGLGDNDTKHYNILFGFIKNKIEVSGALDVLDTDGPAYFIESDAQTLSDREDGTMVSQAPGYTDEWVNQIGCSLNIKIKDVTLRSTCLHKKTGPYIGAGRALNDESELKWQQFTNDLSYTKALTEKLGIKFKLYYDYLVADNYWEIFPEGWKGAYPDGLIGNPSTIHHILGGESALTYQLGTHLFTVGYNYEQIEQVDTESRTNFNPNTYAPLGSFQNISAWGNWNRNVNRYINAVYLQDVWEISKQATLTIGNRYDSYSAMGDTYNTRAGFVWEPVDGLFIKVLYGSAFRAPTFTELYTQNNPSEAGNQNLDPEKVKTYELGVGYHFFTNYNVRVNYFNTYIEDIITVGPKPSAAEPAPYINSGEAVTDGIESEFTYHLFENILGYINCIYQNPRDGDGHKLADVPEWRSNAGVNIGLSRYINTNINVNRTGRRPRVADDPRDSLSPVTLVDFTLIVERFYKTMAVRASVYNVFDQDYRDPSPYPVLVENDYPQHGRSFVGEVKCRF